MTYLDAAFQVLSQAGQALHYKEISKRALEQQLLQPSGLTPDVTMGSRLYTDTQEEGSRFVRAGRGMFDLAERRQGGIEAQVQEINRHTREQLHALLLKMPPKRFESLIMALLLKMGFDENTLKVTPFSGDGGIDVIGVYRAAGLAEVEAAVQAKRWKGNVSAPTVTQLRGSLQVHQQGIVITTSGFSTGARAEAVAQGKTRIALIDGEQLVEMLIKYRVGAVEKRLIVDALDEEWWGELLTGHASSVEKPVVQPVPVLIISPEPPLFSLPPEDEEEPPSIVQEDELTQEPIATAVPAQAEADDSRRRARRIVRHPGRKPAAVTLSGRSQAVKTWKQLLLTVCGWLSEENSEQFSSVAKTLGGKKRRYFSQSPDDLFAPSRIPNSEFYAETNMDAGQIMGLCHSLVVQLGYTTEALSVAFAK